MRPVASYAATAGRKMLALMPPEAQTRAWKGLQSSHLALFRASGGRLGGSLGGVSVLFLHHRGAKSGQVRLSPLLYVEDGEKIGIVASKGGHVRHPAWFHNLKAHPDVEVETARGRRPVRARVAQGEERQQIWRKAVEVWPDYERYQEAVPDRQIPVVVLEAR